MSRFFIPHMEILPAEQRQLWPQLRLAPTLGFVLYGGTAKGILIDAAKKSARASQY